MKLRTKLTSGLLLGAALGASNAVMAGCPTPITLPTATPFTSVTFGDAVTYSLPILGLEVQSAPGQIDDCIVIATGTNGQPINTNFAGMDNAYQTPTGTGGSPWFQTGTAVSPDPGQVSAFVGDQATTWDTRLSALDAFLAGNDLVFYFNHNQTNSGGAVDQDLFIWAQIRLHDDAGLLADRYFYASSMPNASGLPNFGAPGDQSALFTGPQGAATCNYPSGTDAGCTFPTGKVGTPISFNDASYMIHARGQICLNGPVGAGVPVPCDGSGGAVVATVNENLGADRVANAVVFPEINAILNAVSFGGYDVMNIDIRMGCNPATVTTSPTPGVCPPGSVLNNGYEQIFIARLNPIPGPPGGGVPEPATLALVGVALLGAAMGRRRKTH